MGNKPGRSTYIKGRETRHIINERIQSKEVRVIDSEGQQAGILSISDALNLAKSKDLDLLLISPTATPPVCKVIDYGQFKYEQQKKEKLARKSSKAVVTKELKFSPKISDNDFFVRVRRGFTFLKKGYKLKLTVFFKGREIVHSDLGVKVLKRFLEEVDELGTPDSEISRSNRFMNVLVSPRPAGAKKKAQKEKENEAKTEN